MNTIKDNLLLMHSENFGIKNVEEQQIDLVLTPNNDSSCSVKGVVKDADSQPIAGATVKVFDKDGNPFMHILTSDDGAYSFEHLAPGNYSMTAVKNGCRLSLPKNIILIDEELKTVDFSLIKDTTIQLGVVAGVLADGESGLRLSDAKLSLINGETEETIATTVVADDGEFVFYDIKAGSYQLVASKSGYASNSPVLLTLASGTIINTLVKILKDAESNTGTVNGIVKSNGIAVEGVYVGLYLIEGDEKNKTEKLVAFTKTNNLGAYMFGNVSEGKYVVKAKQNK